MKNLEIFKKKLEIEQLKKLLKKKELELKELERN